MLAGTFEKNIRKLNKNIRIFCGDDDSKAAGIFTISSNGEYQHICGIDKNDIPEYPIYDKYGHIVKSGWKRVVNILISHKLINYYEAKKVFNTGSFYIPKYINNTNSNILDNIEYKSLNKNDIIDLMDKVKDTL